MWFKKIFFRLYQKGLWLAARFISFKEPKLQIGENKYLEIPTILRGKGLRNVYIIIDQYFYENKLIDPLLKELDASNIKYLLYTKSRPNPTLAQVEEAFSAYTLSSMDAIIAIGGGSPLDLAKMVGIKAVYPRRSVAKFKGILKVVRRIPLLFAIPTTVGTGSEATLAAVVSNDETHEKYAIMSPNLIPKYAYLDATFIKTLPPHLISTTAMDALTHAIEAYIGKANTRLTKRYAKEATKAVLLNVFKAYDAQDKEALNALHLAAYKAGVAFGQAYVGNVHAIAHTMGGFYDVPHGLANAVILPHILRAYGSKVIKPLSELAYFAGLAHHEVKEKDAAALLITTIEELNKKMAIPQTFNGLIKEQDIPAMVERAYREANPLYPVPVIFSRTEFRDMYVKLNKKE